ncbi:MAG TPA: hypothetical protein VFI16_07355 [Anaeromyxobacteraceae bacterium]|nr:hypothetical protein [Anaeromyxobacteraceae bacterium]
MRLAIPILAAVALVLPRPVPADDERPGRGRPRVAQAQRPPPPAPLRAAPPAAPAPAIRPAPGAHAGARHPAYPAPPPGSPARPPGYYYGPGYYPYYRSYVSPWAYSAYLAAPWWWGWGWGHGYYPVYPEPPVPAPGEAPPASRINAQFAFAGGPTDQRAFEDPSRRVGPGSSAGVSLRVESKDLGFHAGYDGFFVGRQVDFGSATSLDYFTAHATWSFLSGQSGRLRLEGGLSVLSWPALAPATGLTTSGVTAVGPEAGLSGHLALVGPFGVTGHARVTPWPRMATDLYLAAALRFGPVALTGGWRDLRADGGDTAPDMRFAGPQFGVALLF